MIIFVTQIQASKFNEEIQWASLNLSQAQTFD